MALSTWFSDPRFRRPTAVAQADECVVCKKPVHESPEKHTYVELSVTFMEKKPEPQKADPLQLFFNPERQVTRLRGVCCPDCAPVIADMLLERGLVK